MKLSVAISSLCTALLLVIPAVAAANDKPADLSAKELEALVTQLGDKAWEQRYQAREQLQAWGRENKDDLAKLVLTRWSSLDDPEVQYHLAQILRSIVLNSDYHKGAFLGIRMAQAFTPVVVNGKSYHPIEVSQILDGCVAQEEGIRAGDKILQIDDHVCNNLSFRTEHFVEYIRSKRPGESVELHLLQNGSITVKTIKLGERPVQYNEDLDETLRQERFFREWIKAFLNRHSIHPDKPSHTQ